MLTWIWDHFGFIVCGCIIFLVAVLVVGSRAEANHNEYIETTKLRESAAIEYYVRKEHYQSLPKDTEESSVARKATLEAFKTWEHWAELARQQAPSYNR